MILSQYYRVSIEIHIIVFKKTIVENLPFIASNAAGEYVQAWGNFITRAKSQKTSLGTEVKVKVKEFGSGCKSWDISRAPAYFTGAAPDKYPHHNMLQSVQRSESLDIKYVRQTQ